MAQRQLDPTDPGTDPDAAAVPGRVTGRATGQAAAAPVAGPATATATGDDLADYLRSQATEFLRALRLHRETGSTTGPGHNGRTDRTDRTGDDDTEDPVDAARALRRSVRRINGSLHTFRPLLDPEWTESLRPELAWLSGTLGVEHAYAGRLDRLLLALHRLSGAVFPAQSAGTATGAAGRASGSAPAASRQAPENTGPAAGRPAPDRGSLTVGAAKAGALLERQLTLARTRAHSTALQALGSSRFHAVADNIALLASEVPLAPTAPGAPLTAHAAAAEERLTDAVAALPLVVAGHPYNAQALVHGLSPDPAPHPQDAPWHQVRLLLRLHRYAREVLQGDGAPVDVRLLATGQALDRHRDASEAASAAAQAARTPRIAPATAYALGVLHADQRHEVEAARFAFQQSWQKQPVGAP